MRQVGWLDGEHRHGRITIAGSLLVHIRCQSPQSHFCSIAASNQRQSLSLRACGAIISAFAWAVLAYRYQIPHQSFCKHIWTLCTETKGWLSAWTHDHFSMVFYFFLVPFRPASCRSPQKRRCGWVFHQAVGTESPIVLVTAHSQLTPLLLFRSLGWVSLYP